MDTCPSVCATHSLSSWSRMEGRKRYHYTWVFYGPVSPEVLRELVCSFKGRNICTSNCVYGTNSLQYTEICPCQGYDKCQNELSKTLVEDSEVSQEVFIEDIISSRELLHFACVNQMD